MAQLAVSPTSTATPRASSPLQPVSPLPPISAATGRRLPPRPALLPNPKQNSKTYTSFNDNPVFSDSEGEEDDVATPTGRRSAPSPRAREQVAPAPAGRWTAWGWWRNEKGRGDVEKGTLPARRLAAAFNANRTSGSTTSTSRTLTDGTSGLTPAAAIAAAWKQRSELGDAAGPVSASQRKGKAMLGERTPLLRSPGGSSTTLTLRAGEEASPRLTPRGGGMITSREGVPRLTRECFVAECYCYGRYILTVLVVFGIGGVCLAYWIAGDLIAPSWLTGPSAPGVEGGDASASG